MNQKTIHQNKSQPLESEQAIIRTINQLDAFQKYPIRDLVIHSQKFGQDLKRGKLETNQIRKFLDAINRLKAQITQAEEKKKTAQELFDEIEIEIVLLKPKLAYAAARQSSAKPLSEVMSAAIDKVHSLEDFDRLVQLIESIIAYHKAEGGK